MEPGIWTSVKNDRDVQTAFENQDGFVGAFIFDYFEPGGLDHIDRVHADKELILND